MQNTDTPTTVPRRASRQLVRFATSQNPPWWGHATLWALVGAFMLILAGATSLATQLARPTMINFSYTQLPDGSWFFDGPGSGGDLNFFSGYTYTSGPGWQRWERIFTGVGARNRGPVPPPGMTMDDVMELGHAGFAQLIKDPDPALAGATLHEQVVHTTALAMLSRGDKRYSRGLLLAARPYLLVVGALFFVPGLLIGVIRQIAAIRYRQRVITAQGGQCPRCKYSLQGLGMQSICPECGLDVGESVREAQREVS